MENYFNPPHLNGTLDWDESKYNVFHAIYDIQHKSGNHSSVVSTQQLKEDDLNALFRFYVEGIGVLIITILGIIGNCISGWILSQRKMRSPINCLLLGLAVADTMFILMNIIVLAIPTVATFYKVEISLIVILTPIFFPIAVAAHSASVLLTVAVTVERYVAVCHPFKARVRAFTWRSATYTVIGIFFVATLYNFPHWWDYTCVGIVDTNNTVIRYIPLSTSLRRNPIYEKYYVYLGYFILIYSLPLIILIVFNFLIYRTVKEANLQRRNLTSSEQNETQLARMLVVVVLVFILCNAASLVNIGAKVITGSPNLPGVDSIRNFMIVLNSCINFIIYCSYGEKFREIFVNMWPDAIGRIICRESFTKRQRLSVSSRSCSSDKGRPLSISILRTTSFMTENKVLTPK